MTAPMTCTSSSGDALDSTLIKWRAAIVSPAAAMVCVAATERSAPSRIHRSETAITALARLSWPSVPIRVCTSTSHVGVRFSSQHVESIQISGELMSVGCDLVCQ